MAFHDVRFPETISRRSASGAATLTNIVGIDSGGEERVPRWSGARWRGDARKGLRSLEDCRQTMAFYRNRQGPAHSFRFKDWLDYATTPSGTTFQQDDASVTALDVQLGVGDASKTQFQLVKKYQDSAAATTRNITKPVQGTVKVALDGVLKTEGADFTVNYSTGVVTFGAAPGVGVVVTAGFEFDVPVRFGEEVDLAGLLASIEGHTQASIESIPLIEVIDGLEVQEDAPMRGGSLFVVSTNFEITMVDGLAITVDPQAAGVKVIVPDETTEVANLSHGGPYWIIYNRSATHSVVVHEGDGAGTLVGTIGTSSGKMIVLGHDGSGNKKWYAL